MLEKNRILNSQHQIDAILVVVQDLNQAKVQARALCVVDMDKFALAKAFLLFNKHVLNVQVQVNKSQIHAQVAADKVKNKQVRGFL